jgi:hypothetical protein
MGVEFFHASGSWGSCPTLSHGELRLCLPEPPSGAEVAESGTSRFSVSSSLFGAFFRASSQ